MPNPHQSKQEDLTLDEIGKINELLHERIKVKDIIFGVNQKYICIKCSGIFIQWDLIEEIAKVKKPFSDVFTSIVGMRPIDYISSIKV